MKITIRKIVSLTVVAVSLLAASFALAAIPPAPKITVAPLTYYPLEEALYIEGIARPGSDVELFFETSGNQPVRLSVQANSNGEWFFGERLELRRGEWILRARIINNPSISDWSNPRIIRAVVSGFEVGGITIRYLPTISVLFLILAAGATLFIYSVFRLRKIEHLAHEQETQKKTRALEEKIREKEREAVETVIEEGFSDLRRNITEELAHLEVRSKDRILTKEKEEHRLRLLRELRETEERIERKLKDLS